MKTNIVQYYLDVESKKNLELIETESRMVIARAWGFKADRETLAKEFRALRWLSFKGV